MGLQLKGIERDPELEMEMVFESAEWKQRRTVTENISRSYRTLYRENNSGKIFMTGKLRDKSTLLNYLLSLDYSLLDCPAIVPQRSIEIKVVIK